MRKRKVTYPVARTSRRPAAVAGTPGEPAYVRQGVVAIDVNARTGRKGLTVGTRVRIGNTGLYSGEAAIIVSLALGIIPSAVVRTDAGQTRRARTVDLEPISGVAGSQ